MKRRSGVTWTGASAPARAREAATTVPVGAMGFALSPPGSVASAWVVTSLVRARSSLMSRVSLVSGALTLWAKCSSSSRRGARRFRM